MGVKKRSVRGLLVLVLLSAGRGEAASTIQVLSTEYHVYAEFFGYDSYDITADTPLEGTLRLDIGAGGDMMEPFIRTSASSGQGANHYWLGANVDGQRGWTSYDPFTPGPEGEGLAETTITFKSYGDTLLVHFMAYVDGLGGYPRGDMGFLLEDVTAGTPLPPAEPTDPYGGFIRGEYQLNPSHVFRARVWATIQPDAEWYFWTAGASMYSPIAIPAPGALALAGIGIPMICRLHRRLRRSRG